MATHGFPVKVQIPIGMIIKATVTFEKFKFLNRHDNHSEVFKIPEDFKFVSRKEGMKTLTSKKKRIALANVIS